MTVGWPEGTDLIGLHQLGAAGDGMTGRKHVMTILVENKPGVLARVAGLFARRAFNIDTLAVGPTENPAFSRMTITFDGAVQPAGQVMKQLNKLINVIGIRDLEPTEAVSRELALFKVSVTTESRAEIMQFAQIFRGKVIDASTDSLTVEVTGDYGKIEAFEDLVRPFGLIEMVRTGEVAISRGEAPT